jgi:predicted DNA-binding mobile mystery protein A
MADPKVLAMAIQQLSDVLRKYPLPEDANPPRGGWIRVIRKALGMTQRQLGARLNVSPQAVMEFENAEVKRRITLDSLDRAAQAMGCRVVYALVPESGSLEVVRERHANEVAEAMLKSASHSMNLEAQGVGAKESDRQRQHLVESLLQGSPRRLWQ